jgi:large subunit ribosomal protein L17
MRHRNSFKRLGRKAAHRNSMKKNMITSLLINERIETTKTKAGEVKGSVEKMITRAKVDSVHNRRIVKKTVSNPAAINKLFTDIGPRFKSRPGGYTRIIKLGKRYGDASEMVVLELTERLEEKQDKKPKKKKEKAASEENVQTDEKKSKQEDAAEENIVNEKTEAEKEKAADKSDDEQE